MFKRRKPKTYGQLASDMIYPRGGWLRASTYVIHRLRRLPDQPHRIGRGIAAGTFISFTPLFGFHFVGGAACAWMIRGNILAALLATFVGNPITLPFIAFLSVSLGRTILGIDGDISAHIIISEFGRAGSELWHNMRIIFGPEPVHWDNLIRFFYELYLPYMVGGIISGLVVSTAAHYMTVPVIKAYHRRRAKQMAERIARVRANSAARAIGPQPNREEFPPDSTSPPQ